MSNFVCKKCGSLEYEIKDKPNGTGIAHGLYCAKCGFWHKWLSKDELRKYEQKESKDDIIKRLESENASLRARLDKAVEIPDYVFECINGKVERIFTEYLTVGELKYLEENGYSLTKEAAEARLAELKGEKK